MNSHRFFHCFGASLLLFFSSFSHVFAESVSDRMGERLPAIDVLKMEGLFGENNEGFLAARGSLSDDQQDLLEAENTDRRALYGLIAGKTQTLTEEVGKQRAARIAQQAKAGLWIQNSAGEWVRKG